MRIAFVYDRIYPYSKGGVEKRVADLARHLSPLGYEVERYGIQAWTGPRELESDQGRLIGIPNMAVRADQNTLASRAAFAMRLAVRLWRTDVDLVDAQSMAPLACLMTVIVCRVRGIPCVVTWHEVWLETWVRRVGWVGHIGRLVEYLIARLAPAHVAVSQHTANRLLRLGKKAAVLPNGVDLPPATPSSADRSGAVFIGRLVEHKNPMFMVEAARMATTQSDWIFKIVGDGPLLGELQSAALDLPNLVVIGPLDSEADLFEILSTARVFALPSIREGFGLAALEAMAAGVPVVTVNHPDNATSDLITRSVSGLVTDADPIAFSRSLFNVLEDAALHEVLSTGAREVSHRYSWTSLIGRFDEFYRALGDTPSSVVRDRVEVLGGR